MIVWFHDITAHDAELVGGKGANLGQCARAGLPVPPGFCVSTEAYREGTRCLSEVLIDDAARGDAEAARERVLALPIPESVEAGIRSAYLRLGEPAVAVRSSATAEDLAEASFAGQQDTYLGVVGIEAVLDAVRQCWASLWTDRAVNYRHQQGVAEEGLALAVVVQEMVEADTAGVLFTRDPVTGEGASMLASSSYGLGESVVAALVVPDTFTLSRRTAAVVAREIGSKETRIDSTTSGGTTTSAVPTNARKMASLTDAQLLQLVDLGKRVERCYGTGQDIEWAFVGDTLYLLQARPITTSTPVVEGHPPVKGRLERTLRDDLIEHFPAPFPLDQYAVHQVQDVIQDLIRAAGFRSVAATSLVQGDADGIIRITVTKPQPTPALLSRLPALFLKGMRHDPSQWPHEEAAWREELDEFTGRVSELVSDGDDAVLTMVREAVAHAATITAERFVRYNAPMIINRTIASWLIRLSRPQSVTSPEDLYAGVRYKTAVITTAITNLAATARAVGVADVVVSAPQGHVGEALAADPTGRGFQVHVDAFLTEHGARTARMYLPFSNRSWRENPETFYALLAATLRGTPLTQARATDPARNIELRLPAFLRRRWRRNTAQLQARHIGREGTLYLIEEFFHFARAGVDEIAGRLVDRQQLDDPDDIRLLYFHEVDNALRDDQQQLQPVVKRRRRKRGTAEAIWWDRGHTITDEHALRGLPASAGRASGTARVIHSPDEFHRLQAGDILICPYTDPTWTPLFALASAVVADSGGPLSHAAIVAREYGIPAVLGTGHATSIPDGVSVMVDGTAGTVTITEPS